MQVAYDEVADTYATRFPSTEPELPCDLAMISHFASLLPGSRHVLDAGCGAGRMMPLLATLGCRVEGIDLSPAMIQHARREHPQFRARVGSLRHLPFPDAAFDGVFSWYSTIHSTAQDLPGIAVEARRVLRPAGLFLVAFQAGQGTVDLAAAYRRHGHEVELQRFNRTPDELASVLESGGMTMLMRFERAAAAHERSGQAVLIARV